jgi:hypothetical protein
MVTTAAPVSVTTTTAIKTLLQLCGSVPLSIVEWGISFDGFAAAAPGKVELIDTAAIFATVTAFAAADVAPYKDPNALANTAGASGVPLNLGTALSGYTATAEGSITATRLLDLQLMAPTAQYIHQFPLGERPEVLAGKCLRVRTTFAAAINALAYVVFEV